MNSRFRVLLVLVACCGLPSRRMASFRAGGPIRIRGSARIRYLLFWRGSELTYMESDALGKPEPKYRTEIRTRWTKQNLYFLFVCPYEESHRVPTTATDCLWCKSRESKYGIGKS